jgi:hypothetical protein
LPVDRRGASVALAVAVQHCAPLAVIRWIAVPTFVRTANNDPPAREQSGNRRSRHCRPDNLVGLVSDHHRVHRDKLTAVPDRVARWASA